MGNFFRPTLAANESLQLILGKDSGFYNFGYLSYVNSTPPYLWSYCAYTSDGIKIYENKVDVVSSIKVKNVDLYGSSVTSVLSISTANPTSSLQFSRPRLYEFSIQFINCVKGTQRSNVFLQCGQGSVFPLTASNYSGVTGGSYSYDLTPNHNVLSTTDNGIAIFNDVLEVGSSISGSITFTVVGASTGTGILYAYTLQTYSNVPTKGGATFGFGTVQMPAAYPTMTAVRLFCFNGNFTGGTMMIVYN